MCHDFISWNPMMSHVSPQTIVFCDENVEYDYITLVKFIKLSCGTKSVLHNIPHIQYEWWNILHNIVSPKEHCYGSK